MDNNVALGLAIAAVAGVWVVSSRLRLKRRAAPAACERCGAERLPNGPCPRCSPPENANR